MVENGATVLNEGSSARVYWWVPRKEVWINKCDEV
jgi:hypothetical protein